MRSTSNEFLNAHMLMYFHRIQAKITFRSGMKSSNDGHALAQNASLFWLVIEPSQLVVTRLHGTYPLIAIVSVTSRLHSLILPTRVLTFGKQLAHDSDRRRISSAPHL